MDGRGIRPTFKKIKSIVDFPLPKTIVELRRFLGLANFYRRNVKNAAQIQAPLNNFLRDSRKNDKRVIPWDSLSKAAFEQVKHKLANATLLSHPSVNAEICLITDASNTGIGAALEQRIENEWKPIAFFSRKLTPAQCNYSAYDRELTAMFEAVKYFKYFLKARDFKIVTDHKPLVYAFKQRLDKASPRQLNQL